MWSVKITILFTTMYYGVFICLQINYVMDPVVNLKRPTPEAAELCIICQESKHDVLFDATPQGLISVRDATAARTKLRDVKFRDAID